MEPSLAILRVVRTTSLSFLVLATGILGAQTHLQIANVELPDAPSAYLPQTNTLSGISSSSPQAQSGVITGTVMAEDNAPISGAHVTLIDASGTQATVETDTSGFFRLAGFIAGTAQLVVAQTQFSTWKKDDLTLEPQKDLNLGTITLKIAPLATEVTAKTQHEVAEEQLHNETKQRIVGVIPNFWVIYDPHPVPLSSGQKFHLAFRSFIDPVTFGFAALSAGIEQSSNTFPGYGRGASGYGKRYGAALGDTLSSTVLGGAVFPSLFHQDPRYYYKGTGTTRSRILYALASSIRCPGDNGHWQPNYSFILGNFTAGALSNAYYPASDRGVGLTIGNAALATASASFGALVEEFILPRFTTNRKPKP